MSKATRSKRTRVFLVDDHPLVGEWLASLIGQEPDPELCGQAGDAGPVDERAAPKAEGYYPKIGFDAHPSAWVIAAVRRVD